MATRNKLAPLPRDDSPRATTRPVRRPGVMERLRFELVVRDIEQNVDAYVRLLALTRPGPGTNGWQSRIRRRIDRLQDEHQAAEMLETMLEALDEHENGRGDPAGTAT